MHTSSVRYFAGAWLAGIIAGALLNAQTASVPSPGQVTSSTSRVDSPPSGTDAAAEPPPPPPSIPQVPLPPIASTDIYDPAWQQIAHAVNEPAEPHPARLTNLSGRAPVGSGAQTLILGAVIEGSGTLPTLVRAIGPSLESFGVTTPLPFAPQLSVYTAGHLAAKTNRVSAAANAVAPTVGAFIARYVPDESALAIGDAALVGQAYAGSLTAHCDGSDNNRGIGMVEFYDCSKGAPTSPRFVNFSARGQVDSGNGVMIVGFAIAGQGSARLLLRATGPTLASFGVIGTIANPEIELYSGQSLLARNDNWQDGGPVAAAAIQDAGSESGAFPITDANDAAMIVTLPPGTYTLHVRGLPASTGGALSGVALAEIYHLRDLVALEPFDAARSTNATGLDIFCRLTASDPTHNRIISPYSIETALALTYVGAAGQTRTEMATVLRLPEGNATLQLGFSALRDGLNATAARSPLINPQPSSPVSPVNSIEWIGVNRLFGQANYPFRPAFLATMRDGFDAPLQSLDFEFNWESARLAINAWVADQTHGKILDLIPPGGTVETTRLALVNALYLRAPWNTPFGAAGTAPRPFSTPTGTRTVATMRGTAYYGYAAESDCQVATLDYLGAELQCIIILPDAAHTVSSVAARLGATDFFRWANLPTAYVALYLPKFKVTASSVALKKTLEALGMRTAFDDPRTSANFDGMAPRHVPVDYLAIDDVYHQIWIAFDENGTEAAAATGVTAIVPQIAILEPLEMRVDRPFLFAIQHRPTGVCLFLGQITDPS